MKKVLLCIGVVLVLFLVFGAHAAPPQGDLRDFNGTWLKLTVKPQKGLEFTGYDSMNAPQKMTAGARKIYACMDVYGGYSPNPQAYLRFFDKDGTPIGHGYLRWNAGTNLEFLGYLGAYIATDVTYIPGANGFPLEESLTDTELSGHVNVKGNAVDKIKIKSISGEGIILAPDATEATGRFAGFGYILNGGFTRDKNVPQVNPACGEIVEWF